MHLPQDVEKDTLDFLETLRKFPNVVMHGPVTSEVLADGLRRMDALLICYKIKNDQNHHKVLEYLGSGNVIVSSFMSSYQDDKTGLIEMVTNSENNDELPGIFDRVINNLDYYNSSAMRQKRVAYAKEFSYYNNIMRIEQFADSKNQKVGQ
jgi:hypothetical protein